MSDAYLPDLDRRCDPTPRQAAYAVAIGATANIMFVVGATAMLLAFALANRPNDVSSQQGSGWLQ